MRDPETDRLLTDVRKAVVAALDGGVAVRACIWDATRAAVDGEATGCASAEARRTADDACRSIEPSTVAADPGSHPPHLSPYSGETAACPKCGHEGCATTYRKEGDRRGSDFYALAADERIERLERHCPNCQFAWDEALADVSPAIADRDQLLRLLNGFGIGARHDHSCADHRESHVSLTAGDETQGKPGLYALFVFDDATGAFKSMGVWE